MEKKIKVLQVIPKLGYGGAETGCYDLAHYLPEQECKSFIATSGEDKPTLSIMGYPANMTPTNLLSLFIIGDPF